MDPRAGDRDRRHAGENRRRIKGESGLEGYFPQGIEAMAGRSDCRAVATPQRIEAIAEAEQRRPLSVRNRLGCEGSVALAPSPPSAAAGTPDLATIIAFELLYV